MLQEEDEADLALIYPSPKASNLNSPVKPRESSDQHVYEILNFRVGKRSDSLNMTLEQPSRLSSILSFFCIPPSCHPSRVPVNELDSDDEECSQYASLHQEPMSALSSKSWSNPFSQSHDANLPVVSDEAK